MSTSFDFSETNFLLSNKVILSFKFGDLLDRYGLHAFQKDFLSVDISIFEKKSEVKSFFLFIKSYNKISTC